MSETPDQGVEVAVPFKDGPTTPERVATHLDMGEPDQQVRDHTRSVNAWAWRQAFAQAVVRAAVDQASPDAEPEPLVWPEDYTLGCTMLAARLIRRRNSPAGVQAFGDEGAVYVARNDPDVALLLRLGSYAAPGVG